MNVLLHTCCGPCTIYPLRRLRERGHRVTGFFYNPNIHPYLEYRRRLETLARYAGEVDLPMVWRDSYDLEQYLRAALADPGNRCRACYRLRLAAVAAEARRQGLGAFTTTLLVSPYQKHELIREIGEEMAAGAGLDFLYEDFRPGWRKAMEEARALDLYRQPYCGCIFSEKERYSKPRRGGNN